MRLFVLQVSAAAVVEAGKRPVLWQPTTEGPGDPAWDSAFGSDSVLVWLGGVVPRVGPLFLPRVSKLPFQMQSGRRH